MERERLFHSSKMHAILIIEKLVVHSHTGAVVDISLINQSTDEFSKQVVDKPVRIIIINFSPKSTKTDQNASVPSACYIFTLLNKG